MSIGDGFAIWAGKALFDFACFLVFVIVLSVLYWLLDRNSRK